LNRNSKIFACALLIIFLLTPYLPIKISHSKKIPLDGLQIQYDGQAREIGGGWYDYDYTLIYTAKGSEIYHVDEYIRSGLFGRHYWWDVDAHTRIISNSFSQFVDSYHSFYFIPPYVSIGSVVSINSGMSDGMFEVVGESLFMNTYPCWILYDLETGSTAWYSKETQLLLYAHIFTTDHNGNQYEIYSTLMSINYDLYDDDIHPPIITITNPSSLSDSETGTFSWTVVDPSGFYYIGVFLDDEPVIYMNPTGSIEIPNIIGTHILQITATDNDRDYAFDKLTSSAFSSVTVFDDDITGPNISITSIGDATDENPGFWSISAYDSESGLDSIVVEIDGKHVGNLAGDYPVPNTLGPHTVSVTAANADLDRGPIDQDNATLSDTLTIVDDDISGPKLSDLKISVTPFEVVLSFIAVDVSGVGLIEFQFDGEMKSPINQSQMGDFYSFKFRNIWTMGHGTHEIRITVWDVDDDRPNDSSFSIFSGTYNIDTEDMINYVLWEIADLQDKVDGRINYLFDLIIISQLEVAEWFINEALNAYQDNATSKSVILDKLAKANIELSDVITIILDCIGFVSDEDADFISAYLHRIRDHITLTMGVIVGTEDAIEIAQIETEIMQLADKVFNNYGLFITLAINIYLWRASENLDWAIFWMAKGCMETAMTYISQSIYILESANCTIIQLKNSGDISEDEAQAIFKAINEVRTKLTVLYTQFLLVSI